MGIIQEIENKRRHKDAQGLQSFIDCPKCKKGYLHYYWSIFAGVEWAECSTKNCFNYKKGKKPKLKLRKKTKLKLRKKKQFTLI